MRSSDAFEQLMTELEQTAAEFWNISRENALFLTILIKSLEARRVLEVGASNGYSTLWFARAVRENAESSGSGDTNNCEVITLENDAGRAAVARENYRRAGLDATITLLEGDARTLIRECVEPFDFVFLDAEKSEYAEYLRAALPLVRVGGLIVGDDTTSLRAQMTEYVELAFSHPLLESVDVPIDDGLIISRKTA